MGAKDSKRSCLSYEDAVKRMSDSEFKRVCEAFKRLTGGGQLLNRHAFTQNVLGDGVPLTIAEWLYTGCGGGPRGIVLRDLICGLVLLTKGTQDEKIKFLWTLYCNDSGTCITRNEFQSALQIEGTLPPNGSNKPNLWWDHTLISLFGVGQDKIGFDQFKAWIEYNNEATVLSKWLLSNPCVTLSSELETPTFYQTLAGVTHLEEQDICELEKCFWSLQSSSGSGQLDLNCISSLVSPPVPSSACLGLFLALDVNRDGHVDFKELCCGISAACRGPIAERMKFCFKIFDEDRDGYLNNKELLHMIDILVFIVKENTTHFQAHKSNTSTLERQNCCRQSRGNSTTRKEVQKQTRTAQQNSVSQSSDASENQANKMTFLCGTDYLDEAYTKALDSLSKRLTLEQSLSQEDFLMWGLDENPLVEPLLELLFQVCHVALGLKPYCRHHEYEIVTGWLEREEQRGYRVGQFWYLISSDWWQMWLNYTSSPRSNFDHCSCRPDHRIPVEEGIVCDESFTSTGTDYTSHSNEFTSNSTESMGDLLSRGDSCSIASSSGVSSSSGTAVKRSQGAPGPIDNSNLVAEPQLKVGTLTGEGGRLKRDTPLVQHRDFELIPDSLWKALALWYGGPLPLPRQVIRPPGSVDVDLELYPLNLRILRHQSQQSGSPATWSSVVGGYGAAALSTAGITTSPVPSPRRFLAHTAAFSRLANVRQVIEFLATRLGFQFEDVRLWLVRENTVLLEDEYTTLQELGVQDNDQLLLELRNKDLTWPEELGALASGTSGVNALMSSERRPTITLPPGATGLHNLGNTCFMNAALQAVSNTRPLTQYFQRDMQLCELNSSNPLGTRGQVARRYAELCRELWAGSTRSVAPMKLRWCVTKHAPHLGGGGQHDSQELLAWLLDALHEDLNRVTGKHYTELRDSDGRPDAEVADEAWQQHLARDHSIITDLFYGQLKSKVTCQTCGHESVRFDAFNLLSLPLPMESYILCEVLVVRLSGDVPVKYGLRLNSEARYLELKQQLEPLCDIPPDRLLFAEMAYSQIRQILADEARIHPTTAAEIHAYELPSSDLCEKTSCFSSDTEAELSKSPSPLARSPESSNAKERSDSTIRLSNGIVFKKPSMSIHSSHSSTCTDNSMKMPTYLIAVHRKCVRQETYFLSQHKSKPSLFGVPLLLSCNSSSTCQGMYEAVWRQVTRLLSPLPQSDQTNHAMDCDDSLGYEFPFTLKAILNGGQICALCPWTQFCRGCSLPCSSELLFDVCKAGQNVMCVAIDWDPTALHLRYQSNREKVWLEHESVATCRKLHTEPIDLDHCLKAFTSEERLETKYHCSSCQDKQPATKKLQIWRLPPILIIHLKRFDYVNSKWVKTQKVVNFPFKNFDPTAYLASVPQETILRHKHLLDKQKCTISELESSSESNCTQPNKIIEENCDFSGDGEDVDEENLQVVTSRLVDVDSIRRDRGDTSRCANISEGKIVSRRMSKVRERLESTSLMRTPVIDEDLKDFHKHKLLDGQDPFDLKYQLYAVVSHSGLLNGGHYISYACNPNGNWYCYNDSSCREVTADTSKENADPTVTKSPQTSEKLLNKSANVTPLSRRKVLGAKNVSELCDDNVSVSSSEFSSSKKDVTSNNSYLHGNAMPTFELDPEKLEGSVKKTEATDVLKRSGSKSSINSYKCAYSDAKIPKIDTSAAYILFYERSGLNYKPYLPDVASSEHIVPEVELDENESELRKQLCSIQ